MAVEFTNYQWRHGKRAAITGSYDDVDDRGIFYQFEGDIRVYFMRGGGAGGFDRWKNKTHELLADQGATTITHPDEYQGD